MNNKQVLLLYKICKRLAQKYTFGHYDIDDIAQEAFIIGMRLLPKFNRRKGMSLESFLYMSINNRLKDFKRDNYARIFHKCEYCNNEENPEVPCEYCQRRNWRIETRKNIVEPLDIDNICSDEESGVTTNNDFIEDVEIAELKSIVDQELPVNLRSDYIRMLHDIQIPKTRRNLIEFSIIQILEKHGYEI